MTEERGGSYGAVQRSLANSEAIDWLILLQEDPEDEAVRARFTLWHEASALNAEAWADTLGVSDRITAIPPAHAERWHDYPGVDEHPQIIPIAQARERKRRFWPALGSRRMASAMSIAAAVALAIMAGPEMMLRLQADALSQTGEVRTLHLADGSTVAMAPQSAVAIDVKSGHRQVRVLRGSAYFDVAHDPAHPFRVLSGDTVTTVLGTAFEVQDHADGAQVSVSVRRGLVGVACRDQQHDMDKLAVGDAVDVACDGSEAVRRKVDPARVATWRKAQIVVSDRPVREVINALRPWHRGFIIARGSRLDSDRVTGVYDARQPDRALRGLAAAHAVTIRNLTPWITVVTAD